MGELTPRQIVTELDKYIIGQEKAKKSVAVALRSRYRRNLLDEEMKSEITPKNILMIGPTGVGKTEIARRLAKLVNAPFIKVEATKFTEVGYVGRDVESIVRDLVETAIRIVKSERVSEVKEKAHKLALDKIAEILVPVPEKQGGVKNPFEMLFSSQSKEEENNEEEEIKDESIKLNRSIMRQRLESGEIDEQIVELEVEDNSNGSVELIAGFGMDQSGINIQDMLGGIFPKKTKKRKVSVKEAIKLTTNQEAQKLIDMDSVTEEAIKRAEEKGIIFIDELDKIAGKGYSSGPDVSREGVQRDILPIVEGSTVMTKYGPVKTDYILFIAAGAFHIAKVSDLIPELQGRFPVRVELNSLTKENFVEILTKPNNALVKQYKALLATEELQIEFKESAIDEIADIAVYMNEHMENIGARRLYTVMENLFEDISFEAPELENNKIIIDRNFVKDAFMDKVKKKDFDQYII